MTTHLLDDVGDGLRSARHLHTARRRWAQTAARWRACKARWPRHDCAAAEPQSVGCAAVVVHTMCERGAGRRGEQRWWRGGLSARTLRIASRISSVCSRARAGGEPSWFLAVVVTTEQRQQRQQRQQRNHLAGREWAYRRQAGGGWLAFSRT